MSRCAGSRPSTIIIYDQWLWHSHTLQWQTLWWPWAITDASSIFAIMILFLQMLLRRKMHCSSAHNNSPLQAAQYIIKPGKSPWFPWCVTMIHVSHSSSVNVRFSMLAMVYMYVNLGVKIYNWCIRLLLDATHVSSPWRTLGHSVLGTRYSVLGRGGDSTINQSHRTNRLDYLIWSIFDNKLI